MFGLLLAELDQTLFATALPTIAGDLGQSNDLLWISVVNIAAGVVVMPLLGRLGDGLGRPPVFVAALTVLVLGSVVGGLAPNMSMLLLARALQGLGGGGLIVLVQAMVADLFALRRRAVVLNAIGAVFALSAVAGPVLGGWLTQTLGWRWAFWLNVPVGAVAIGAAWRFLRTGTPPTGPPKLPLRNLAPMVLCVGGATLVASWVGSSAHPMPLLVIGVSGVCLTAGVSFVVFERRSDHPLLPVALLRSRDYTVTVVAGFILGVALFASVAYLPTYLQMAQGLDPTQAGLMMLTLMAGLGLATIGAAQVVARTGRTRALPVVGAATGAVALALLSLLQTDTDRVIIGIDLALLGVGIGCAWEVLVVLAQSAAPPGTVGAATAGNGFFREVGVLIGTTIVGGVFVSSTTARLAGQPPPEVAGSWASLTPARLAALPAHQQAAVAEAYNAALTPIFAALVPVVLISVVLLLLLRPVYLARTKVRVMEPDALTREAG